LYIIQKITVHILALSFNQPKLCSNPTWSENGTTFVDNNTIGGPARGFFISNDDTIFVTAYQKSQILIWSKGSVAPVRSISVNLFEYTALFITINSDIYFENGNEKGRIEKWTMASNDTIFVTKFSDNCFGMFVDVSNTLYCSLRLKNQVVKISFDEKNATEIPIAGIGSTGVAANQLNGPWGIFVDTNFYLYVADAYNYRIQLFRLGQSNGETVAGNGVPQNLTLNFPTDVVLDADGYLYIADDHNGRIIRSGHGEWQCIIGCSGSKGSAPNQLNLAYGLCFDTRGNLYIADEHNNRIQKFTLATNSCGKYNSKSTVKTLEYPLNLCLITHEKKFMFSPCLKTNLLAFYAL
jgi:hypothetical protein